ncbi:hypothetical protein [Lachnospira multipara]|uniref:Uncharacterized protein n=1 Tax=Lachnospira multipara TaxID=28051 RepID=A0A1H5RTC5_9FIRM|nr:hypothetical protein [Lachnospira multipara]SEF40978.1 hypothetical protein SAMN05216537_101249 [Lachnospira multipara]
MKVESSVISFATTHEENTYSYKETVSMDVAASKGAVIAILDLSKESKAMTMKEAMLSYQKQEKENEKKQREENEARNLNSLAKILKANKNSNQYQINDELDMKIKMIKEILAALKGKKVSGNVLRNLENVKKKSSSNLNESSSLATRQVSSPSSRGVSNGTAWQKITASSGFVSEQESITFASVGKVATADGRSIDFNLEVSMSRAFMAETNMLEVKDYIKMDPLVINLDSNITSVSDQKFFFDLDADGDEESISFAGEGSGFLALDKNNDGVINDGSELFGTKSGDGFKDLDVYDEDGNGWIDENDSIFNKLKVWTKDDEGKDLLIDLKSADVGAIYLDSANFQFSLKDVSNNLNAEIKKTGVYLKESTGAVGTISHVDLVL